MSKPIRSVGLIGFGMIGKVHSFAYQALPYYLRSDALSFQPVIRAIAVSSQQSAAQVQEITGIKNVVTNWREITENPEIDIVHIALPNSLHLPALLSAIENRKAIYCEKPLTSHYAEARQVADALKNFAYDKTSRMVFHLRFYAALSRARQLIEEGRLGRIYEYHISYRHSSSADSSTPYKWKHAPGGGVILDLGAHLFDLIDWLIGPPTELLAETQIAHSRRIDAAGQEQIVTVEDAFTAITRGVSGGGEYRGVIDATKLATGREDELELEINGEKGSLRFSLLDPHFLDFYDTERPGGPFGGERGWQKIAAGARYAAPQTDFPSPKSSIGWLRGHIGSLADFLMSIEKNEPGNPNLWQGIRVQKMLETCRLSAEKRQWLRLEE